MFSNQLRQVRNITGFLDSIFEILPKRYTQFTARFLQTCKSVAARAARIAAGSSANFAFFTYSRIAFSALLLCNGISGRSKIGKCNYFIDGPIGMNPTQRMQKHVKLTGIIAYDDQLF